jgi:hypothetical protein
MIMINPGSVLFYSQIKLLINLNGIDTIQFCVQVN